MRLLFAVAFVSSLAYILSSEEKIPAQKLISRSTTAEIILPAPVVPKVETITPDVQTSATRKNEIDEFWQEQHYRWESILQELLDRIDSERASVILKNYYQERKRHISVVGRLIQTHASDRLWNLEEDRNESNLKRIFQEHYEAVKADHDAFNESIRYSHPDGLDEIAIDL